jgi:hypothetical protein
MICKTLIEQGWNECSNQFKKYARCFYKRFDTPTNCHCNHDKTGIQVEISVVESSGSCELELGGELSDGTWVRLHNHGLPKDLDAVLSLIPRLLATWEAANKTNDLTSSKGVLELMVERGAKAWKDVPDASAWVEELRGNDAP